MLRQEGNRIQPFGKNHKEAARRASAHCALHLCHYATNTPPVAVKLRSSHLAKRETHLQKIIQKFFSLDRITHQRYQRSLELGGYGVQMNRIHALLLASPFRAGRGSLHRPEAAWNGSAAASPRHQLHQRVQVILQ